MLNQIILSRLTSTDSPTIHSMQSDELENPCSYAGWIYPIRYLLAMRYLKVKQQTLENFRQQKTYPVPEESYKQALIERLSKRQSILSFVRPRKSTKQPISALPLKSWMVYPVLLVSMAVGLWNLNHWYQQRKIENVLANHLPYYSDLVHRKLLFKHNGVDSLIAKVDEDIAAEKTKILGDLPPGKIRDLIGKQLTQLIDSSVSIKDILLGFKQVNIALDVEKIPYYLSPKSFSLPCSSFVDAPMEEMMMLKKLESLLSKNNPEYCRTTMMTVYKVEKRNQLHYGDTELPLFLSNRIDKVPAVDSALGLTYRETGIGSLILLDRIKRFTTESILPALTFQGRNFVIPYWMQGYYEIEELVTKSYKNDLKNIYHDPAELRNVKNSVKLLLRDKNRMGNSKMQQTLQRNDADSSNNNVFGNGLDAISVLLGETGKQDDKHAENVEIPSLDKLDDVLLPSIEYHEAYHQIKKHDWKTPTWIKTVFKEQNETQIDHNMEELGAYLSQLAQTEEGHKIWLSKLLIFSLNPMTKGQAEYYASGIILTTMQSLYLGDVVKPRYDASVEEKTEIFKQLTSFSNSEIKRYAKLAFEILFEREVPELKR